MKKRGKLRQEQEKKNSNIINKVQNNPLSQNISIFQTKTELLFGQKSFLEIILGLIKGAQVDYLTNNFIKIDYKSNKNEKNKKKSNNFNDTSKIKKVLNDLKDSLIEIKKEKEKKIDLFKKIKQQKKSDLKKLIFNTVYSKRSVSNSNYINSNFETLITENNEIYYNNETPELKLLNFKVQNEIIKVENLTKRKQFIIQYYKTPHNINEHRTEIICEDKRNNESMNQVLHQKLIQQREKFIEIVNMKSLQDIRINNMQSQSIGYRNALKDIHKSYRYVNTQEVITEENKSYLETVNEDEKKEENLKKEISVCNNNINIESKDINDLKKLKLIDVNDVEKYLKLNMNINVNINYNKQYINNHFDGKKKEKDEENSSDFSKNENLDENDSDLDKKNPKINNDSNLSNENNIIDKE